MNKNAIGSMNDDLLQYTIDTLPEGARGELYALADESGVSVLTAARNLADVGKMYRPLRRLEHGDDEGLWDIPAPPLDK